MEQAPWTFSYRIQELIADVLAGIMLWLPIALYLGAVFWALRWCGTNFLHWEQPDVAVLAGLLTWVLYDRTGYILSSEPNDGAKNSKPKGQ